MAAGLVSIEHNLLGPVSCVVTACSASANAIGDAAELIRRGAAEVMVAGGAEAAITTYGLAGFNQARALSTRNDEPTKASRPFDAERDGFVMGEGAGAVVLEDRERAVERGANILGEMVGYGMSADAYHITLPRPGGTGAARAMQRQCAMPASSRRTSHTSMLTGPRPKPTTPGRRRRSRLRWEPRGLPGADLLDQVDDRPHPRWCRGG